MNRPVPPIDHRDPFVGASLLLDPIGRSGPAWVCRAFKRCFSLDAGSGFFTNGATPAETLGKKAYSVTVVFRAEFAPSQDEVVFEDAGANVGARLGPEGLRWRHWSTDDALVTVGPVEPGRWHVLQVRFGARSLLVRLNGGPWSSPAFVDPLERTAHFWRVANNKNGIDVKAVIVDPTTRDASYFDQVLTWARAELGLSSNDLAPEIDALEPIDLDPTVGTVRFRGRNLVSLTNVNVGSARHLVLPGIGSHAWFGESKFFELGVPRVALLGGVGWSFTTLVNCRDLTADRGLFANQTLFAEASNSVGVEIFEGGARVWQRVYGLTVFATVASDTVGNRLVEAQWDGKVIRIRVDCGEWAEAPAASLDGVGKFKIGCGASENAFFKGRIVEMLFVNRVLDESELRVVVADVNHTNCSTFGGVPPAPADFSLIQPSARFKPGGYTKDGVWECDSVVRGSIKRNLKARDGSRPDLVAVPERGLVGFSGLPVFDASTKPLTSLIAFSDLFGRSGFSGWALVDVSSRGKRTVVGSPEPGRFSVSTGVDGLASLRATSDKGPVVLRAPLRDGWNLLQWRCDGETLSFRTNGDRWLNAPFGSMLSEALAETLVIAPASAHPVGRVAEIATSNWNFDERVHDHVLMYINRTYGLGFNGLTPSDFDPTSLKLSLYCRASGYSRGVWVGVGSAGDSDGRNLVAYGDAPRVASDELVATFPTIADKPKMVTLVGPAGVCAMPLTTRSSL